MTVKLLPYKAGSESAKSLAQALGIKRLKLEGSKWKGKAGDIIVNWGNSKGTPNKRDANYLNHPLFVKTAANKLDSQYAFEGSPYCLPFTTAKAEARLIIQRGQGTIVCRTKLTGNSGEGIVIAETVDQLVDAPLYTVYKKKTDEYRVHVFKGKVISVQRKSRKRDVPDEQVNWKVRNLEGGFIFARQGFQVPESVVEAALGAMRDLQLDFGAVDIGYHKKEGTYVYEVNTACGLDGSNLTDYVEAFCDELGLDKPERPADYVPPTLPIPVVPEVVPAPQPAPVPEPVVEEVAEEVAALDEIKVGDTFFVKQGLPHDAHTDVDEMLFVNRKMAGMAGREIEVTVVHDKDGIREYEFTAEDFFWVREWVYKAGEDPVYRGHNARNVEAGEGQGIKPEAVVVLGAKAIKFKIGNLNRVLTKEQQLQLAGMIAQI